MIVKRWPGNGDKNKLRDIPGSQLKKVEDSNNGEEAYIAVTNKGYLSDVEINVGDNKIYRCHTAKRKRRAVNEYRNAPLSENTQYAIFIRVFYDKAEVSIFVIYNYDNNNDDDLIKKDLISQLIIK